MVYVERELKPSGGMKPAPRFGSMVYVGSFYERAWTAVEREPHVNRSSKRQRNSCVARGQTLRSSDKYGLTSAKIDARSGRVRWRNAGQDTTPQTIGDTFLRETCHYWQASLTRCIQRRVCMEASGAWTDEVTVITAHSMEECCTWDGAAIKIRHHDTRAIDKAGDIRSGLPLIQFNGSNSFAEGLVQLRGKYSGELQSVLRIPALIPYKSKGRKHKGYRTKYGHIRIQRL
ncbi:hypothetical protein C8R47DRAFT_1080843 [Mycena vitilis]|nr:hypothetical protein C8R47DRAFT_1080843 [Mycena vitilis]